MPSSGSMAACGGAGHDAGPMTLGAGVRFHGRDPVGLGYTIVAVTCFSSQQGGTVRRRSGTRA